MAEFLPLARWMQAVRPEFKGLQSSPSVQRGIPKRCPRNFYQLHPSDLKVSITRRFRVNLPETRHVIKSTVSRRQFLVASLAISSISFILLPEFHIKDVPPVAE